MTLCCCFAMAERNCDLRAVAHRKSNALALRLESKAAAVAIKKKISDANVNGEAEGSLFELGLIGRAEP